MKNGLLLLVFTASRYLGIPESRRVFSEYNGGAARGQDWPIYFIEQKGRETPLRVQRYYKKMTYANKKCIFFIFYAR